MRGIANVVEILSKPSFTRFDYDLSGKSFFERGLFLLKNPPRLTVDHEFKFKMADGNIIVVPSGFITDGASVPRWFWAIPGFSPYGVLLSGGLPHDMGYQYGLLLAEYNPNKFYPEESLQYLAVYGSRIPEGLIPVYIGYSQEFFDNVLYNVCKLSSPSFKFVPKVAYLTLRCAGHVAWNRYRTFGPATYNSINSLGLPGVNHAGYVY
jgi:hypothetical protein